MNKFVTKLGYFWKRWLDLLDEIFLSMKGFMFWVATGMLLLEKIDGYIWLAVVGFVLTGKFLDKTNLNKRNM